MVFEFDGKMKPEDEGEFYPVLPDEDIEVLNDNDFSETIPIVSLRNTVLLPGVVLPITLGRNRSINAVNDAYKKDRVIGIVSQIDATVEEPELKDLHRVGTVAKIVKRLKLPDGSTTAIIQGNRRFVLDSIESEEPFILGKITKLPEELIEVDLEIDAIVSALREQANEIIKLSPHIPNEATALLNNIDKPNFLVNFIMSNLPIEVSEKQKFLQLNNFKEKANFCLEALNGQLQLLQLKDQIQSKVKGDLDKQQRDYFLHQQMRIIQEELGGDSVSRDVKRLKERAEKMKWSKEVAETFEKELLKLERTNPAASEYSVILNYLELLLDLPWSVYTKDTFNIKKAKKILDDDHFGLEKVKERILEYLAVLKLKGDFKSPILCLVGPPGVGKTSLGKSIAEAIDRKYVRMALGGLHDEAEIRGHRKTYIGAMPGRIIQSLKKAKSSNPVFILDEIDKIGSDFRGDPASALLEVLDPEQNANFYDNYLELEYDLSKVMFIATANSLQTIHPALRDRMEIIQLEGYATEEKLQIAQKYLLPKQREMHGLKAKDVKVPPKTLENIIDSYTRESGVRELDRMLASVMRYVAKNVVSEEGYDVVIKENMLSKILGAEKYDTTIYKDENPPGVAVGLAYTRVGGDILFIESTFTKGSGALKLTGSLGDVMKESAQTAITYVQAHTADIGLNAEIFKHINIHIHVPEGATPKDGPSAGITLLSAVSSLLTGRAIKPFIAMTGEITLRGKVLPVGGIKEKILAAKRAGMKEIIMCEANEKDVLEIREDYINDLVFHYVKDMSQVIQLALNTEVTHKIDWSQYIEKLKIK